jgi:serine/threonine protein kinase
MDIVLNKYQLLGEIGNGSFSKIYKAKDIYTSKECAIKIEKKSKNLQTNEIVFIIREAHIHNRLHDVEQIPRLLWFGHDTQFYYMVLPLLSGTFRNLLFDLEIPSNRESWIRVGQHMLHSIRALHNHGYIHRDIKPDNFMFDDKGKVYLIDLGMCKNYLRNGQHIAPKIRTPASGIIGTANYISVHVHQMKEPSRRDDVESVCYVLWKICGGLDWGNDSTDRLETILDKKLALLQDPRIPPELLCLLQKTRSLDYYDEPCYDLTGGGHVLANPPHTPSIL